jgi:S-methylmethionine-dependent homocysteine/selenocysteine methylase
MSEQRPLLLDGSMGHELKARGATESFTTAMLSNVTHADLITSIHAEYISAGCDVLTTNSFTLTPSIMAGEGRAAALPSLLHAACDCASRAAASASGGRNVLVAGCLPTMRHCYLPELVGSDEELRAHYEFIAKEIAPRVDFFLAEVCRVLAVCNSHLRASAKAERCANESRQRTRRFVRAPRLVRPSRFLRPSVSRAGSP